MYHFREYLLENPPRYERESNPRPFGYMSDCDTTTPSLVLWYTSRGRSHNAHINMLLRLNHGSNEGCKLTDNTAEHHGCNEFVRCCMPRPQSILFHIASIANTRMSLSHSRYLECYLKIRYIHGALRSGYATIRNAQCNNSEDNLF